MNFFTVGFLLANFQLNADWASGYFVRLVGALFMLGGIAELSGFEVRVKTLTPLCAMLAVLSAASGVTMLMMSDKGTVMSRSVCILDAMVTTALAAVAFRALFGCLAENTSIVANEPEVAKAASGYDKLLIVAAVSLAADAVNRFTGGTVAADAAGVVMAIARVVFYVMLIAGAFRFNRLRCSFNAAHPVE